jgi:sugar fermentation stimulation protein A
MEFPQPLTRGTLVSRYKRFFADVVLEDGTAVTAHCPNPGAMLGLKDPGLPVWLSKSSDPKRKLAHTLELVEVDDALVGVNTLHPNRLVAEALATDAIPELAGYDVHRREVKYGTNSRVDFLLTGVERPVAWLEVKGVTLHRGDGLAEWPDCKSDRGARHVRELAERVRHGDRAVILFVVQRMDCRGFGLAADLDPAFAAAFKEVTAEGVEALVYACDVGAQAVRITNRIPFG